MTEHVAASVHQRLLNIAKQDNRRVNDLMQHYALERWLFRLSQWACRERFVLKGALLLVAWHTPVTRPTRDIDLLARIGNDLDLIRVAESKSSQAAENQDSAAVSESVEG